VTGPFGLLKPLTKSVIEAALLVVMPSPWSSWSSWSS
jgi:hypothetical protein